MLTVKGSRAIFVSMVTDIAHSNRPSAPTPGWHGTPVVPGLATAPVLVVRVGLDEEALAAYDDRPGDAVEALGRFDAAAAAVAEGYERRAARVSGAAAAVLAASAGLARDKGLRGSVRRQLNQGTGLVAAVGAATNHFAEVLTSMGGLMAERAADLRDVERRLVAHLVGLDEPGVVLPENPAILAAIDLAPSDTAALDPAVVLALVTERGGPTSHTAIIARQLGIPCVVGVAGLIHGPAPVASGMTLLVDGEAGTVRPAPADAHALVAADRERRTAIASWTGPGRTNDGHRVKLLANVADGPSAQAATAAPVEGVGLFRTELAFLNRPDEPSVAEQTAVYAEVLGAFAGVGPVVIRTLDAGSDKPIAFASHPGEENPALGVRGLRLSFADPGLLERQLDAIAAAAESTGVETRVMAPMVATVAEAADFAARVRARGLPAGVMVEVPSAALLADRMLAEVDFLSIGTNDLTQYAMAADRQATDLAHLTDPWQPAVLQLIAMTAAAGRRAGKPVGVCGEAAADPLLACVLVGMGITSLSMAPTAVRAVGARLAGLSSDACADAAAAVLRADGPHDAREAVRALLG